MALSGLWHGFAWHLLLWGVLHGLYLVVERLYLSRRSAGPPAEWPWPSQLAAGFGLFALVTLAWVPFRLAIPASLEFWSALLDWTRLEIQPRRLYVALGILVPAIALDWIQQRQQDEAAVRRWPRLAQAGGMGRCAVTGVDRHRGRSGPAIRLPGLLMASPRFARAHAPSALGRALPLAALVVLTGCASNQVPSPSPLPPIPAQHDWVDYGTIFQAGAEGEWDHLLWGGFTATAVKKEGVFYLYYQGARDYQESPDATVTWRAIGLATSHDGVNFTKHPDNPVLTWAPQQGVEEGAVSGGVTLDEAGEFVMYYGANTQVSATTVNADARLATSTDGIHFVDRGVALDHRDRSVWGSGDELFPILSLSTPGGLYVYYLPNGGLLGRHLGVAWGSRPQALTESAPVVSGRARVPAWGTAGQARVGADRYALFLNNLADPRIEVRLVSLAAPDRLSAPVATYQFDGVLQATILLDEATRTWFMYYAGENGYGVRLAPAGPIDHSPPSVPAGISATPVSHGRIHLTWSPATDPDTGVVAYAVYRNGVAVGQVRGVSYSDTGWDGETAYRYEVAAVNFHGVEGSRSASALVAALVPLPLRGNP